MFEAETNEQKIKDFSKYLEDNLSLDDATAEDLIKLDEELLNDTRLVSLTLSLKVDEKNVFPKAEFTKLCQTLKKNNTLTSVTIQFCDFGDNNEGPAILADLIKENKKLLVLNLMFAGVENKGVALIAKSAATATAIEHVNLQKNEIGNDGVKPIVEMLEKNANIAVCILDKNPKITDEGAKLLIDFMERTGRSVDFGISEAHGLSLKVAKELETLTEKNKETLQNKK